MLSDILLKKYILEIKLKTNLQLYTPIRYFRGLTTKEQVKKRIITIRNNIQEAKKDSSKPKFFKKFDTDKGIKTKQSSWTLKFYKKFGEKMNEIKTKNPQWNIFRRVAKATGLKYAILKTSYLRGVAAYKTGHRPGATAEQWGYARMYSLIIRYKHKSLPHDKDLALKLINDE